MSGVHSMIERLAILDHQIERMQGLVVKALAASHESADLEQTLRVLLATRTVYAARLVQIERDAPPADDSAARKR